MIRGATPKLARHVLLGSLVLVIGFVIGRIEVVLLAFPVLLGLAWGVATTEPPVVDVKILLDSDRCLEGERIEVRLDVLADRHVEVEAGVAIPSSFRVVEGSPRTVVELWPAEPALLSIGLQAVRWGTHRIGPAAVRAHGATGLVSYEQVHPHEVLVRVYPRPERLRRGIRPPDTQVFSGDYVARVAGEGLEFAEVRAFRPGDRIRRVNWKVTARRNELFVNQFHPERNADVVFFLDTFADVGTAGSTSLDLAVRGTAILTRHYLAHKDRVGLIAFGGLLKWLRAAMGHGHVEHIVEYLLQVDVALSYAWKDIDFLPRGILPPMALVMAFSPLEDERAINALVDLRARGFPLVVVDTLDEELVQPDRSLPLNIPYRAWRLEREARRFWLVSSGIPVVRWSGRESLEAALAQVPPFRRRVRMSVR
jgi:uncharacterized protein (DUF58 family)